MWDGLIPADFRPEAIMEKYQEELDEAEDGSPEAAELYTRMQEEFNGAPVNEVLDETLVRLPGFIAPLNYSDDLIWCLHSYPCPTRKSDCPGASSRRARHQARGLLRPHLGYG